MERKENLVSKNRGKVIHVAGLSYPDVYENSYNHCIKNNLWPGFARVIDTAPSREDTNDAVLELLKTIVTSDSKTTKGYLIKFVRENFVGPSAYADVGKVASKIIKQQCLSKQGKWISTTTARHIRTRK
mgnify:CR=1 FL=1